MTDGEMRFPPSKLPKGTAPSEQPERQFKKRHHIKPGKDYTGMSAYKRCKTMADLPPWAKQALWRRIACPDETYTQTAALWKRRGRQLQVYAHTPGGKECREAALKILNDMEDPVARARFMASLAAEPLTMQAFSILRMALDKNDLSEAAKQNRFLLEMIGVKQPDSKVVGPTVFNVTFGDTTFTLEAPMGDATHEKIIDAEIIDE